MKLNGVIRDLSSRKRTQSRSLEHVEAGLAEQQRGVPLREASKSGSPSKKFSSLTLTLDKGSRF